MEKAWKRHPEPHDIDFEVLQHWRARTIYIGSMLYQLFHFEPFTLLTARFKLNQVLSENLLAHVGFNSTGNPIKRLYPYEGVLQGSIQYLWRHGLTERRRLFYDQRRFEYRFLEESRRTLENFVHLSDIKI